MTVHHLPTPTQPQQSVRHPEKLIRLAGLARAMLDEARQAPCDQAGCERLRRIYERTLSQLGGLLSPDLQAELVYLTDTFETESPTPSEIRVAQAELVGWLEGLIDGLAAAALNQWYAAGEQAGEEGVEVPGLDARPMPGQYL